MSALTDRIRTAQVRAGEQAVVDHLHEMGLGPFLEKLPTFSVHMHCTMCHGSEQFDGGPCHCVSPEPSDQSSGSES